MKSKTLEIKRTVFGRVAPGANVIFAEPASLPEGISYNSITGEITFNEIGQYSIKWWVATETTTKGPIEFALIPVPGDPILGCSPTKTGQVTGFSILDIAETPTTLSLVSQCKADTVFSWETQVKAYLSVIPIEPVGKLSSVIPFSLGKEGVNLGTDNQGDPLAVAFSGFGVSSYSNQYLKEGEWASGIITMDSESKFGTSFIMPRDGILRTIYVMFSTKYENSYEEDFIVRPFVCIAVSNADKLVFTILQDTMTYTEPYEVGVEQPISGIKKGSLKNLDIEITEGTLVGIVTGIMRDREGSFGMQFYISGGLYLE